MPSLRYFEEIRYGSVEGLSVLVDPKDNSLYVTQPTIERLMGYRPNSAREKLTSKSLKTFAGKSLQLGKLVTARDTKGRENKIKAIPFPVFLELVYWEAFEGKEQSAAVARKMLRAGFADSFSSIVLEQCGIKLSVDERQFVITEYLAGYHAFQDWVRDTHLAVYGVTPTREYYRELAVVINRYLFNRDHFFANRLDHAQTNELRRIENFQIEFMHKKLSTKKEDPASLVKEYIDRLTC